MSDPVLQSSSAGERASGLERIVDALIPGDGLYPSASRAGVHAKLMERSYGLLGAGYIDRLLAPLGLSGGGGSVGGSDEPLGEATLGGLPDEIPAGDPRGSSDDLVARISAYEAADPDTFEVLLSIVYMSYYESLVVKDAIRASGHDYHDRPQPEGYAMAPFDRENPLEAPRHNRGHYVPTDSVRRVSLDGLGNLLDRVG